MTPFYKIVCKQLHLLESQQLMGEMQKANDERLKALDENIKKAEESDGETEIREAMIAKAHYLSKIGNKTDALAQFRAILDKTVLPGCRLDITFHLIRMGFFYNDRDLITTNIEKANSLIEEGGDWDRRNRLKVYRGLHSLSVRDFDASAKHFLDAVATFTSYELMDYKSFIIYTVLTSMIALKRQDLRAKVRVSVNLIYQAVAVICIRVRVKGRIFTPFGSVTFVLSSHAFSLVFATFAKILYLGHKKQKTLVEV